MNDLRKIDQEQSVLRWGGLAGMLGGIFFILTWVVVVAGPVGLEDPADLEGWVTRFPDIRAARVVENGIYLVALLLEVTLFLALYRALRRTSDTRPLVAGDLGHIRCDALRRVLCRADKSHSSRTGHARGSGLWQEFWRVERGARGGRSRSSSSPNGRSLLYDRRGQLFRMPHLLSRPGMEGLQSVESPVGSLEGRGMTRVR
jgi:hypothetical protein